MTRPRFSANRAFQRAALLYLAACLCLCCAFPAGVRAEAQDDAFELDVVESQQMFAALSDKTLIAASGAGAWGGQLNVDADGAFAGYYYDEDAGDGVYYEVSFTGRFHETVEVHGLYAYWLRVDEMETRNEPGTEADGIYGERVVYVEPPFKAGDILVLTLIDTPADSVPETVREEIGGTFGEWEDYSRFVTLTRLADGWGFFADTDSAERVELETPAETAGGEPETQPDIVPMPFAPTGGFTDRVVEICESNGLGLHAYKTPMNYHDPSLNLEVESVRTNCSIHDGIVDYGFYVLIDQYADPEIAAEVFRIFLEQERQSSSNSSSCQMVVSGSDEAIGYYCHYSYNDENSGLVYYCLCDGCIVNLLAAEPENFDAGMAIIEQIEAARRGE